MNDAVKECYRDVTTVARAESRRGSVRLAGRVLGLIRYVMVKVNVLLVPPLVHPRSPELPLGVLTAMLAVPGPAIRVVVSVTCSCVLLTTVVATVFPLMTTTDAETKWEPLTDRIKSSTLENAIVSGERDEICGDGRALPHNGLSELQPGRTSKTHNSVLRHRMGRYAEVMGCSI